MASLLEKWKNLFDTRRKLKKNFSSQAQQLKRGKSNHMIRFTRASLECPGQGDQIGRNFALWVIVYFGQFF
jgi:hypothetical protein